ncbi:MAG: hypothetical protein EHM61_16980 [Acidobacteria bacterium]|nr:MAG: hypothetical protein EHM61_16980 [Acidobacteriota bacterium]
MPARNFWIGDWWPVLAIGLVSFGLLLFGAIGLLSARRKPGRYVLHSAVLAASIPVTFSLLVLSVLFLVQFGSYHTLVEWEVLARVKAGTQSRYGAFKVIYTALASGQERGTRTLDLYGDAWAVRADVIRWKPFMRYLGYDRSLKFTRLQGVFRREQDYLEHPRTNETIGKGTDRIWLRAHRQQAPWPFRYFIESAYTTSVSGSTSSPDLYDIVGTKEGIGLRKVDY